MGSLSFLELVATSCFALAVLHTFLVSQFQKLALKYKPGSPGENFFHLIGEVEVSFGLWAAVFLSFMALGISNSTAVEYLNSRNFTEPAFVFVIMAVCSTKPVLDFAKLLLSLFSKALPLPNSIAIFISTLTIGPLLGSFITEPAAMTVTALILLEQFYNRKISTRFKYAMLGLLFVNISIGGTLTPYAAPPVLMVSGKWNWDLSFMLINFGWKAALSCILSSCLTAWVFKKELLAMDTNKKKEKKRAQLPLWVYVTHLIFLALIVMNHTHTTVFFGLFLFFLGLYTVTQEYQETLRLREGLLVAFFLGGIIVLGEPQKWWLEPVIKNLDSLPLYAGAIGLTSITDNAALTFLGSQIPTLSESSRYALVAGSVVGGGLTVIANAPNPVGFGLLNSSFGEKGISPLFLAVSATPYTVLAGILFWVF